MTEHFMQFLIKYIKYCFNNDEEFKYIDFNVTEAYSYNESLSCPQIAIQILSNSENERYSSFESENVSNFGIQLDVFAEITDINGTIYNAERASSKIADKLKLYMNDLKFKLLNKNIVKLVRIGLDYRTPIDESGSVYSNIIRYDCQTIYPYNIELENIVKGE